MTVRGRVQDGTVVIEDSVRLPEGAEVSVTVCEPVPHANTKLTPEQKKRMQEALARIQAIPNENPGDNFSGADHDRVLYGAP